MSELLLDAAGRRRSPATLPDFHAGRAPRNTGIRYPAAHRRSRRSSPSCAPPRTAPRGRHGRLGLGAARALAAGARAIAGRAAVVRDQRTDPRAALVGLGGP